MVFAGDAKAGDVDGAGDSPSIQLRFGSPVLIASATWKSNHIACRIEIMADQNTSKLQKCKLQNLKPAIHSRKFESSI